MKVAFGRFMYPAQGARLQQAIGRALNVFEDVPIGARVSDGASKTQPVNVH